MTDAVQDAEDYFDQHYVDSTFTEYLRNDVKNRPNMSEDHDEFIDRLHDILDVVDDVQEVKDSLDQIQDDIIAFDWGTDDDEPMLSMIAVARHSFDFWIFVMDTTQTLSKKSRTALGYLGLGLILDAARVCVADALAAVRTLDEMEGEDDRVPAALTQAGMISSRVWLRLRGYDLGYGINRTVDQYIMF